MNRPHTAVRSRLAVTTLSDLLMISINGLRDYNVDKYVLSWLKTGQRGALDKLTGKSSSPKGAYIRRGRKLPSYLLDSPKWRLHILLSTNFRCIFINLLLKSS